MTNRPTPFVVDPAAGMTVAGPVGGPLTFKARGEQTGGALTVFENLIAPGQGPPLHTHANEDEAWYVLSGELRFRLQDELHDARAGSFVFVPRETPHCFQNIGTTLARLLVMFTPAGMERFFDEFAALSAPDPAAFSEIGASYGMNVLGSVEGVDGGVPAAASDHEPVHRHRDAKRDHERQPE
jgi:quercetin dioxygenase-like cupin family protein